MQRVWSLQAVPRVRSRWCQQEARGDGQGPARGSGSIGWLDSRPRGPVLPAHQRVRLWLVQLVHQGGGGRATVTIAVTKIVTLIRESQLSETARPGKH